MIGVGSAGDTTVTLPSALGGAAVGCNRTAFGKTGCVEIQDRQWTYRGSYFIIEGFFSNGTSRGDIRSTTNTAPDHFALRHLEITAPAKATGGCMTGVLNTQWVIFRNHLHDCGDHLLAATTENDVQGVQLSRNDTTWIIENEIYHNGGDGVGINAGQSNPIPRSRFSYVGRNHIWENGENCIDIKTAEDVVFTSNICHGVVDAAASDGTAIVLNDENATPVPGDWRIFVFNNIIYDAVVGVRSQTQSYVFGNVISNLSGWCFVTFGSSSASWWENNTCVDTNGLLLRFGGSTDITLRARNNLFTSEATLRMDVSNAATSDPATDIRNNQFPPNDSETYKWGGRAYTSLTAWEAASSGLAADNRVGAGGYVDSARNDYRLVQGAPAVDGGTNSLTSYDRFFALYGLRVDYDIRGTKRPAAATWDIGAYEYAATLPAKPTNLRIVP